MADEFTAISQLPAGQAIKTASGSGTLDSFAIGGTTPKAVTSTLFSGPGTGLTGVATALTAGNVTTNANLTGAITSIGNAASLGSFSSADFATALTDKTGTGVVVFATSPAFTGSPTVPTQAASDNSTKIASTQFVTSAVSDAIMGVNPAIAVQVATTQASDTSGLVYNNGAAGVGATFIGSINTPITWDGYTFTTVGQRGLIKNDTQSPSGAFNGIYYLSQLQTSLLPPILTRATDYNSPSNINNTGAIPVINGTAYPSGNLGTSWLLISGVSTVGIDPLTYQLFSLPANKTLTTTLTNTHIFVGNASNIATDVAISGDATIANTGTLTIANLAVSNAKIANSTIDLTAKVTGILPNSNTTATDANTASAIVARDGSGNFTAGTITANLTGTASTATVANTVSTANEATDTTCFPLFITTSGTQSLQPKNNTGLTYNSNTNNLAATTFTGALTGNASTATTLATARNIGGVSFNGSADITVATATAGFTVSGGDLSATAITSTGNTTFSSTGQRILADLTNSTPSNRLLFQTTTASSQSSVGVIPSSSGSLSSFGAYGLPDPDNSSRMQFFMDEGLGYGGINSRHTGTGTTRPIVFQIDSTTMLSIATDGTLAVGANNITCTGSLGATASRLTKGWFTDLQVTNAISGSVTGNAATATALQNSRSIGGVSFNGTANIVPQTIQSVNEAIDTTCFPLFISASGTQSLQPLNNSGFTYNSNTNNLTATTFTGALSGNATTATTLATTRAIYGNNFDGSAALAQIIASTYGGTGNGFTKFSGATTSEKTYTLPDASTTILTTNEAVTVAQGGTGQTSYTNGQLLIGNTTGNTLAKATLTGTSNQVNVTNGASSITLSTPQDIATGSSPTFSTLTLSNGGSALTGTNAVINMPNTLADGSYINVGTSGRNIGVFSGGNFFLTANLDYNATSNTYVYNSSAGASAIEIGQASIDLKYAASGTAGNSITPSVGFSVTTGGNASFFGAGSFGSGTNVIFIGNGTAPSGNPTGGGILYTASGALKYKGSSGTTTNVGNAEPHCDKCGADFGVGWENPIYGGEMIVCKVCETGYLDNLRKCLNYLVTNNQDALAEMADFLASDISHIRWNANRDDEYRNVRIPLDIGAQMANVIIQ